MSSRPSEPRLKAAIEQQSALVPSLAASTLRLRKYLDALELTTRPVRARNWREIGR